MAQQEAVKVQAPTSKAAPPPEGEKKDAAPIPDTASAADKAFDTEATTHLFEFLRRYEPAADNATPDMLLERYSIDMSSPLPDLDTKLCKAYAVNDLQETDRQLYALLC